MRAHPQACVAIVALSGGLGLFAIEALGEGLPATFSKTLLLLGVIVGIEAAGITIGYALLGRQLGLWRGEPEGGDPR